MSPQTGSRCLALVTDSFGVPGGIAQYNRDFLSGLARCDGMSSVVVLPRHGRNKSNLPGGVTELPQRKGRASYVVAALWSALTRRACIVFCGHLYMAALAAAIARATRSKLIVQMHGIESWSRPSPMRRRAVEAADLVLCVSRYTRAAVLGWAAIAPERVVVLPNTVGESFTPGDGAQLRAELGLGGRRILLTVGGMDSRERDKGHDRVIAALPRLIADGHDVAYVVVGEGSHRAQLEALAAASGLSERVIFLGALDNAKLIEAYRMADLYVMPSTGEGFGIAFLEAMACGTPAVGLNAAGAVDALADGELGIVTTEFDFPATVSRLLGAPKTDGVVLAARVRAHFGSEAFTARLRGAVLPLLPQTA